MNDKIINFLKELPEDNRDFAVGSIFRLIDIKNVPNIDFRIASNFIIKDQKDSDLCPAFSTTSASEIQEGIELSPEYQFALMKHLSGDDYKEWGADLRQACKSLVSVGSLPRHLSPFSLETNGRNFVANYDNWEAFEKNNLSEIKKYAKESFISIIGVNSHFNNIRIALWQFKEERRAIVVGAKWRSSWTEAKNGIIEDKDYKNEDGFGHAFIIIGQKIIDNKIYLEAQLSNGKEIGSNGLFYFPENIVNSEFKKYGAFMFNDLPKEDAKFYQENNVFIGDSKVKILLYKLINLIKKYV